MTLSEWLLNGIQFLLMAYGYLLLAMVVVYWVPDLAQTQLGYWLSRITDPYLQLFRRWIPPLRVGGVTWDVSFLVAVLVYFFVQQGVVSVLADLVRGVTA